MHKTGTKKTRRPLPTPKAAKAVETTVEKKKRRPLPTPVRARVDISAVVEGEDAKTPECAKVDGKLENANMRRPTLGGEGGDGDKKSKTKSKRVKQRRKPTRKRFDSGDGEAEIDAALQPLVELGVEGQHALEGIGSFDELLDQGFVVETKEEGSGERRPREGDTVQVKVET